MIDTVNQTTPLTERAALADLVTWAEKRPVWQRDALRRLVMNETLDDQAIDELTALCLDPTRPHTPISQSHIAAEANASEPVSLVSIKNPTGINALADQQELSFETSDLTVIYGDNGSGKSGYVRILKSACRSRDTKFKIHRNLKDNTNTPQSAEICFRRGESIEQFNWIYGGKPHNDLSSVSIFDSRSANIHVENTNEVAYIPRPMRMLEALANASDRIKIILDTKINALQDQIPSEISNPSLKKETSAGDSIFSLNSKSEISQINALAELNEQERGHLAALENYFSQDPKHAVARLEKQGREVDSIHKTLQALVNATTAAAFVEINELRKTHSDAEKAALVASQQLFSASPLPEIGHTTWQKLWDAARKYADTVAYPKKIFPPSEPDTLCVLCQQPLSAEAINRQQKFESFVKGSTKAKEVTARVNLDAVLANLKNQMPHLGDILEYRDFLAIEINDELLARQVRRTFVMARWRLRAMIRAYREPMSLCADPLQALFNLATDLKRHATQFSADTQSDKYMKLKSEYHELKDRVALAPLLPKIKEWIACLKKIDTIETAIRTTSKRSITEKNKELSNCMVTEALRDRFVQEINDLRLSRIPIEMRKEKDKQAVSYFRIVLKERPDIKAVGEIFSEGEHRCIALAAFLAELVTAQSYSCIVFDDPMSSLDHTHRHRVASRLVKEAKHRQVIVFTHDLVFLYNIRRAAEDANRPIEIRNIWRYDGQPGYVENEAPAKAKSAHQMCNTLRSSIKEVKPRFRNLCSSERTKFCRITINHLRMAWEQAISNYLRPVIERFDNRVKLSSIYKIGILTEDDMKTVMAAQARLSNDLHFSAEALNPEDMSLDDLLSEIEILEVWIQSIRDRQKNAVKPELI